MVFGVAILCLLRDFAWKYFKRRYNPESYHYVQEIQKYNIQDYRPRMEQFQKAIRKVRQVQRIKNKEVLPFLKLKVKIKIKLLDYMILLKKRSFWGIIRK